MLYGTGCSLDITNGLLALAVGMQQYYATTALPAVILYPGVTSREVAINTTFANLVELEDGGPQLPNTNANVLALWSRLYL